MRNNAPHFISVCLLGGGLCIIIIVIIIILLKIYFTTLVDCKHYDQKRPFPFVEVGCMHEKRSIDTIQVCMRFVTCVEDTHLLSDAEKKRRKKEKKKEKT
jgi:hypothetical protein